MTYRIKNFMNRTYYN